MKRATLAVLIVLILGAFELRLWHLDQPSVWHDEAWSIRAIRDPINTPDDNTPPVYYTLIHFLWLGAGDSAFALRYGSVLLDLITLVLAVRVAGQWAGRNAAILAAVLFGSSPLLWAYAREIRAYVMVPLLALLLLWLVDRLIMSHKDFPWRVWMSILVAEIVLLYAHNLSVPVVIWMNFVVSAAWIWQQRWRWLLIWMGGQVAVLVAYLPWVLGQSRSGTPLNTPPTLELDLIWKIWQAYFAPVVVQVGQDNALMLGSAVFAATILASAVVVLYWKPDRRALLVLSQVILLPALATGLLIIAHIDFHPRYYILGVPSALMLVVLGVESLPLLDLRRIAMTAVTALAWGVATASLIGVNDNPKYQHDDFRALARYYADLPADTLIVIPYGWEPALEVYYANKLDIQAEILGIPLHSGADTVIEQVNKIVQDRHGQVNVELLTWYQLPADVRGMYPCLLEAAGYRSGRSYTVQGLNTESYVLERPLELTTISDGAADYQGINRLSAAMGGQQSICVRTSWELEQLTSEDWRVAGRILTIEPSGWIIARSDTDIRRDDQAPTSDWAAGDHGDAFSLLRFPAGAPPVDYRLEARVYSHSTPNGLNPLVNGAPSGQPGILATIQPEGTTQVPPHAGETLVSLNSQAQLVGHDARNGTLNPGQELRITLQWRSTERAEGSVILRGDGWELSQPIATYPDYSLDWHAFVIPADASGEATLTVESDAVEPFVLATYTIQAGDHLFAPPPFDYPFQTSFGTVGELEGFSVGQTTVALNGSLDLTLVWRGIETPNISYQVFTHLLDANGQVIAQHDGFPAEFTRPTTGWVPGEYIVDHHALTFIRDDYQGPARLEVGFYNPDNPKERVLLPDGSDHVILPVEIMVQ